MGFVFLTEACPERSGMILIGIVSIIAYMLQNYDMRVPHITRRWGVSFARYVRSAVRVGNTVSS